MVDYECSKKLLYVFNFVFWVGGAALLGFGAWMYIDPTLVNYLVLVNIRGSDPMLTYAAFIFMGAGGLAVIVGFFGCCGAMRGSQGLLFVYISFLLLIMAAEIVGGVLALMYRGKIESHLQDSMEEQIKFDYYEGMKEKKAWDYLQQERKCCGGIGIDSWKDSKWWNETRTFVNQTQQKEFVPNSCCASGEREVILKCQRDAQNKQAPSEDLYTEGCYDNLEAWIKQHSLIMMILGLAIGGAQIFSFIAACCVRSSLKNRSYEANP